LISLLLEIDMPVKTIQPCSGHSKPSVTIDIHGHAMPRSQDETVQKIEEVITPIAVDLQ